MTSRDETLQRLRGRARTVAPTPIWQSRQTATDLAAQFTRALAAAYGEVRHVPDYKSALQAVDALIEELNAQNIVTNNEDVVINADFPRRWPNIVWHSADNPQKLREACVSADIGISSATAALAETGTVIVHSGEGKSRLVTLLPPVHIVLLPSQRLYADIFTYTQDRGSSHPANVAMISGPSKTADIELTLSIGVHGPKRFVVVLYDKE